MKVGDYVRTKEGYISRVDNIVDDFIWFDNTIYKSYSDSYDTLNENNINDYIVKSSPNIIDLIEVGDYVNGLKVEGVNNGIKGFGTIIFSKDSSIMEDYIYSIVTKEQFESMEYKRGEDSNE